VNGEKIPPYDTDAEEAVIGSLLIDGTSIYKIASLLQPADFYQEQCQWLYGACLTLYQRNEAINQITVAQELDRQGKLAACGGAAYLSHLISMVPTSLDIEHYAQIVYRLAISRRLIEAARKIEAIGYEAGPDVDTSLNKAEDVLFRLRHGQSPRDLVPIRQVLDKYFELPPVAEREGYPALITHVLSGFAGLDEFLGGLQRSDLIIVAGRPSIGKSSFALSIAGNAAIRQGACVALFSLEMAREPLVLRMLASEADVDSRRVQIGRHATDDEEKRIMDAIGVLSEAPIYIDDSPQLRVVEMRSKARRLHYERGIDLIIVDYLQLMQGSGRDEVEKITDNSRSLKALAREFNVPVVAVSQMSRAVESRTTRKPQLSDLRGSGSIEQDADVVVFIYRDDYYFTREEWESQYPDKDYPAGIADIIIAKHRNGPTGEVKLHFVPKSAKFAEISRQEPSLL
jgi:replicative DNA helicase